MKCLLVVDQFLSCSHLTTMILHDTHQYGDMDFMLDKSQYIISSLLAIASTDVGSHKATYHCETAAARFYSGATTVSHAWAAVHPVSQIWNPKLAQPRGDPLQHARVSDVQQVNPPAVELSFIT